MRSSATASAGDDPGPPVTTVGRSSNVVEASARPSAATIAAPMMPASLRSVAGDDRRPHGQARDELVGVLADAPAEDDQVGPHQVLDALQVLVEVGAQAFHDSPRRTRAADADRRSAARPRISICPNSVFGTRMPSTNTPEPTPVPRVRKMTTPALAGPDAEAHLGDPRGVGVVDDGDRALQRFVRFSAIG